MTLKYAGSSITVLVPTATFSGNRLNSAFIKAENVGKPQEKLPTENDVFSLQRNTFPPVLCQS